MIILAYQLQYHLQYIVYCSQNLRLQSSMAKNAVSGVSLTGFQPQLYLLVGCNLRLVFSPIGILFYFIQNRASMTIVEPSGTHTPFSFQVHHFKGGTLILTVKDGSQSPFHLCSKQQIQGKEERRHGPQTFKETSQKYYTTLLITFIGQDLVTDPTQV